MSKDLRGLEFEFADELTFYDENPNFVNHFLKGDEEERHYKFLYLHVLAQVASDLQRPQKGRRLEAERYLSSSDYRLICEYLFGATSQEEFDFIAKKLRTCNAKSAKNIKRYTFSIVDEKTKGKWKRGNSIVEMQQIKLKKGKNGKN